MLEEIKDKTDYFKMEQEMINISWQVWKKIQILQLKNVIIKIKNSMYRFDTGLNK